MNSNLIPTTVTDKNGKQTTVHKRPVSAPAAGVSTIPPVAAPAMEKTAKAARKYKPTEDQLRPHYKHLMSWSRNVDDKLLESFGMEAAYGARYLTLKVSDVEAYSVFSAADFDTALVMMENGITSRDEAVDKLHQQGLDHLVRDYSPIMDAALRSKLDFTMFMEFFKSVRNKDRDPKLFVDAAQANDKKGFREARYGGKPLPYLVLNGSIAYKDLKAITSTHFANKLCGEETIKELIAMNNGERDYNAVQLRRALEESKGELFDDEVIAMINAFGIGSVRGMKSKKRAYQMFLETQDNEKYKYDMWKRRDLIQFHTIMGIYRRTGESANEIIEMFEGGCDAAEAAKALNEGMTLPQVLALGRKEPKSISSGWL